MVSARQILHDVFGYPEFRGQQAAVVDTLAAGQSLLALMPTGAGKSLCYQIPALMREGVAIVVSRSGMTQMGHVLAQQLGLCAIGRATNRRFVCFSGADRLLMQPELAVVRPVSSAAVG